MSANVEVVRRFYEAFGRRDMPGAFATLHPQIEFHEMASLPWGKVFRGHAGIQEFIGALVGHFGNDIRIDVHFYAEAPDNQVVVHATLHAMERSFRYLELWQIAEGKAKRIEPFLDSAPMLSRLRELGRV